MIRIRFVKSKGAISDAIALRAGVCMPFAPSHVECVSRDGLSYIGQHIDGGMQARPSDYDKNDLEHELFIDLPATEGQTIAFYDFVWSKVGQPYDWKSISSFVLPVNHHEVGSAICSASMTLALRAASWFPYPLTVPAHQISPRDLLLMLSGIVLINH